DGEEARQVLADDGLVGGRVAGAQPADEARLVGGHREARAGREIVHADRLREGAPRPRGLGYERVRPREARSASEGSATRTFACASGFLSGDPTAPSSPAAPPPARRASAPGR